MAVLWDVAPCTLVEVYRRLKVLAASTIRAVAGTFHYSEKAYW
jgi:hypothetical protein